MNTEKPPMVAEGILLATQLPTTVNTSTLAIMIRPFLMIQILVFVVGIGRNGAGQHIRRKGDAHRHIGVHVQEGDEHGADDRRRAHTGKAGAKGRPPCRQKR